MALRNAIAKKKQAAAMAASAPQPPTPAADPVAKPTNAPPATATVQAAAVPLAVPTAAPTAAPALAPAPASARAPASAPEPAPKKAGGQAASSSGASGFRAGFLKDTGVSLYPEGSSERGTPGVIDWRGSSTKPVLEVKTSPDAYEVVGLFKEAGTYLGKEDFEVTRTDLKLRVRGNPQDDPRSLVAGFEESVELMPDCDFSGMTAEFRERALRITIPRIKGPVQVNLTEEQTRVLQAMSEEEARALVADSPSPQVLLERLNLAGANAANDELASRIEEVE